MRLTKLSLEDFGPFAAFELVPIDSNLTVIVGPNGAGKSTLLRALRMSNLALGWAGAFDSQAFGDLESYHRADDVMQRKEAS